MTAMEEERYLHLLRYFPEYLDWVREMLRAGKKVFIIGSDLDKLLQYHSAVDSEVLDPVCLWLVAIPTIGSQALSSSTMFQYPPCEKEDLGDGWFASTLANSYDIQVVFYGGCIPDSELHASIRSNSNSNTPVQNLARDSVSYYDVKMEILGEAFLAHNGALPWYSSGQCWLSLTLAITLDDSARTLIIPAISLYRLEENLSSGWAKG
jgi:hypothetical protein